MASSLFSCFAGLVGYYDDTAMAPAKKLWKIYDHQCRFPEWSLQQLIAGELDAYAESVQVYYRAGDDTEAVTQMVKEREPVNIALHRSYNEEAMEKAFGYARGAYARSTPDKLMPNIAIYCRTPMRRFPDRAACSPGEVKDVHVINVVGFGFDTSRQPDAQYFCTEGTAKVPPESAKEHEIIKQYAKVWRYAFHCAKEKNLKTVYWTACGGGAFAGPNMGRYHAEWKPKSLAMVGMRHRAGDAGRGEVVEAEPGSEFEGIQVRVYEHTENPRRNAFLRQQVHGPEGRREEENILVFGPDFDAETSLLVNAWDPWSLVGNGNAADASFDGYFGRSTAMALLCWPQTNPLMLRDFRPVETQAN